MAQLVVPAQLSYSSGTSQVPLLGDTVGDNLDRTVAALPDAAAMIDCAVGKRWTYRELAAAVDTLAPGRLHSGIG